MNRPDYGMSILRRLFPTDARAFRWLAGWPMDLKLGVRMLVKTPGLTVIAVVALAVAIGAGATYLEFVKDLVRPSLSAPGAERIVGIRVWNTERRETEGRMTAEFLKWRHEATALQDIGAMRPLGHHLITSDGMAGRTRSIEITAGAFRLFPVAPLIGRTLSETDEEPAAAPVVVIGEDLWVERFNRDPSVIGRTVRLGRSVPTIVGVMPSAFGFPINHNLWVPLKLASGEGGSGQETIQMFGQLKNDVTAEMAQAELNTMLSPREERLYVEVRPYLESLLSAETSRVPIEKVLYAGNLLFVMLLVICGANVATLVFARTAMRETEITVRTALGASRGRISAQLFAEGLVLSLLAALMGLLLAAAIGRWLGRGVTDAIGQPLPFWWNETLSPATVFYAIALAVFAALIIGVLPALKATGAHLQHRLREAGASGSSMKFGGLWTGVIVTQVAITVIFLSAVVALGWETYASRSDRDVTFARNEFLTAPIVLADDQAASHQASFRTLADTLRAQPGVDHVSYATEMPGTTFGRFRLEFATPAVAADAVPHEDGLWVRSARVGPDYFDTVGATLLAGRVFAGSEIDANRPVAVVDESFVRLILGGRNALGLMVREPPLEPGSAAGSWHEIVGVVRDVTVKPRKKSFDGTLYVPSSINAGAPMHLLVRTRGAASSMVQAVLASASATPAVRLETPKTLDRVAADEAIATTMAVRVLGVVSAIALLLSMAGIYALVSFTLARRTREIGIRMALGAAPRRIITGTFSRAFVQVAIGVALGALPGAVIMLTSNEEAGGMAGPGVGLMLLLGLCVMGVALLACVVPLRRALRIEPTQALRADT